MTDDYHAAPGAPVPPDNGVRAIEAALLDVRAALENNMGVLQAEVRAARGVEERLLYFWLRPSLLDIMAALELNVSGIDGPYGPFCSSIPRTLLQYITIPYSIEGHILCGSQFSKWIGQFHFINNVEVERRLRA
eukprot:IDg3077t1